MIRNIFLYISMLLLVSGCENSRKEENGKAVIISPENRGAIDLSGIAFANIGDYDPSGDQDGRTQADNMGNGIYVLHYKKCVYIQRPLHQTLKIQNFPKNSG